MAIDVAALQQKHPSWNIIRALEAPNGGIWALGADGGVFALNAQGGTDGTVAPWLGSYTALDQGDRQGDRRIIDIVKDFETGGYTLVSDKVGQNYTFAGNERLDRPTTEPIPTAAPKVDFTDADLNTLTATLNQNGLGDLVNDAWKYYTDPTKGAGDAAATLAYLPTTQAYRDRFPGLVEMGEQGRAWTPGQWNRYHNDLFEAATAAGLPPGMISREDVGKMLVGGVSVNEAVGRIEAAGQAALNADPAVIARMREWGFTDGDLTAFYLDPDKAEPLLMRKEKELTARVSVAGGRAGYDIDLGEAGQLRTWGVDEGEAKEGFAGLATMHPLFANTVGETAEGSEITEAEQLSATFGDNAPARQEIRTRTARRKANFEGGGGAASGGNGRTGLG